VLGVVAVLSFVLVSALPATSAGRAATGSVATPAEVSPTAAPFNPPCAPVIPGVCVSIANTTEPDIVPTPPGFVSSVQPTAATNLPLIVKSQTPLNGTSSSSARSGPDAPVILNVTGTLWDGVPYYSTYDGSVYHSATQVWWDGPIPTTNSSYPWWYLVNISADAVNGQPEFFPGMAINWSIEITFNVSGNFVHEGGAQGPFFHYTYLGAWPYSPYAGAPHDAGAGAYAQDLTTTVIPSQPNWNDSVSLTLNTTGADVLQNATIGQAYLDVAETAANGTPLASTSFVLPPGNTTGAGVAKTRFVIPASFAQEAGATVRYEAHVADAWGDWVDSGPTTYTVGGNGSFAVGQFGDDLALTTTPSVTFPTLVGPGTPIALHLRSANARSAVSSAIVFYSVHLPLLQEVTSFSSPLARLNSTSFVGAIPGLPVGAGVNFTVEAWDFNSLGEISPNYNYSVAPLSTVLGSIALNGTFFYVAVHDAGDHAWVTGAVVTVTGPGGYFRSVGTTLGGLAYPNATGAPFQPIVVPAGATYVVTVADPAFRPAGPAPSSEIQVAIPATHTMGGHEILLTTPTYSVFLNGSILVFWLNATSAAPSSAGPNTTLLLIGGAVGLAATGLVLFPLLGWWRRIQKRREEETRRVTL
jgi:hypothetical protein